MADDAQINGDVIRYTTKELLAEIRGDLAFIRADISTRFHALKGALDAYNLRLSEVERQVRDHQRLADKNLPVLQELVESNRLQNELKNALEKRDERGFTRKQKLLATGVSLLLIALQVHPFHF